MLHRLEIENFYSIRDRQVIDLRAAANAPDEPGRLAPLWKGSKERAPKVVAIFGANGSGKSNVLRALSFLAWFVKDSFASARGSKMPFERFNNKQMLQHPTRLAFYDSGPADIARLSQPDQPECRFAYELTIGGGIQPCVQKEALDYFPAHAKRRVRLFERNTNGSIKAGKDFGLTGFKQALEKVLRPDASVIATLAQLEHPFSKVIWTNFLHFYSNVLVEKFEPAEPDMITYYGSNPELLENFNYVIERVDLGIRKMQVRQGLDGTIALFLHEGLSEPMRIIHQSHGTRNFIRIFPIIWHALKAGNVAVLDELDASIHPMLLPEILRWFYDPARNPHNAQLWMSCQNATLLEDLTKEEVLFCEKDSTGSTRVYGLSDIQSVRRDDNYYKKYLGGAFGAVPQIG